MEEKKKHFNEWKKKDQHTDVICRQFLEKTKQNSQAAVLNYEVLQKNLEVFVALVEWSISAVEDIGLLNRAY